jgi:Flp pilus assembly protein TadG
VPTMTAHAGHPQGGSVLVLFPVAILIVMLLASITVDATVAFLAQRELAEATAGAANDAATEALVLGTFYRNDRLELDPDVVAAVAEDRVRRVIDTARHTNLQIHAEVLEPAESGCPPRVRVRATSTVSYVFAPVLAGAPDTIDVSTSFTAAPRETGSPAC